MSLSSTIGCHRLVVLALRRKCVTKSEPGGAEAMIQIGCFAATAFCQTLFVGNTGVRQMPHTEPEMLSAVLELSKYDIVAGDSVPRKR